MELDQFKTAWQSINRTEDKLWIEGNRQSSIELRMSAMYKNIKQRTYFGIFSFGLVLLALIGMDYFLFLLHMHIFAVAGLATWIIILGVAVIHIYLVRREHEPTMLEATIFVVLKQKLELVRREKQFYLCFATILYCSLSVGLIMILVGTDATLLSSALALSAFILLGLKARLNGRTHVATYLEPLENELLDCISVYEG